ncbi:uncharacterized protein LOC135832299 [Planococcus citri]|uniref:uncharacterized protein LOC135832299 n=1 Tax=Planococcus citri TaxID=170843 RepID=UPI0031F7A75A
MKHKFPVGMKTAILYPYLALHNRKICCITFHARQAAIFSAIYTMNVSVLVILIYSWRVNENSKNYTQLDEVYYGVQIAYVAIVTVHLFNICLSLLLLYAVLKEKYSLISLWILGTITFTAMEAVCMVYSNVLRDHVNREFDTWSKEEASFFTCRAILNVLPIIGVLKFYNMLRAGVTWKGPETIEL